MQIKMMGLKDIKPYEKNPRRNDKSVDFVANSIKEFGFKVPIVIDKDDVIVCGHTRYKAAKKLKMQEVPCIMADDLTDKQIKAFRLADNKVGESSEWDDDFLDDELALLDDDFDMEEFGFEKFEEEEREKNIDTEDRFTITIDCIDEADATEKYNKLTEMGMECRISTL